MLNAVAAIFTYQQEVFWITRQTYLRAFPGYTAFPGGKVDEGDEVYAIEHPLLAKFPVIEVGALIREIEEELGFDLAEAVRLQQVKQVSKFGTAITPAFQTQRFSAHFYKIELTEKPDFMVDHGEILSADWSLASTLWQQYLAGDRLMVKPNVAAVKALAEDITISSVEPFSERDDPSEVPYLELIHGLGYLPVPSNTLPPAITTNSLLVGDPGSLKLITDPSPASLEVLERLKKTLKPHVLDAIFITHHHPDHHEYAPVLARDLKLPILCSKLTEQRTLARCGQDYFAGVEVRHVQHGQVLTKWLGHEVICHALPGHDDGMMGLAPTNLAWFYIADLAEPGTTVVIPEPEGDMAVYFETLQQVIAMQPKVVIPSHGLPMGGLKLLEKTLKHRQTREQQIYEFYQDGLREDELVNALYPKLSEALLPLAHQNVRQHLRKLGLHE